MRYSTDNYQLSNITNSAVDAASASLSATQAVIAAATVGVYPTTATGFVPIGAVAFTVTPGSGGTTTTGGIASASGGNYNAMPIVTYDIVSGAITNVRIVKPGFYIGASPTAPTLSIPGAAGGGAITLTNGILYANGDGYWVQSADGLKLTRYKNVSGTSTLDTAIKPMPTSDYVDGITRQVISTYANLAAATAGTINGQYALVPQALGFATDKYLNVSGEMVLQDTTPNGAGLLITQEIALEKAPLAVTQPPRAPLVSIDPIYGKFTDGRIIPALSSSTISHNAYSSTKTAGAPGGGTFTPNYTTDTDGNAVHRWQMSSHGHQLYVIPSALTARTTKFKFYIKSNTGAGNQNVTAGLYPSAMTTYAITEAAWTTVSFNGTAASGDNIAVWNYLDQLPRDVLIKDAMQLYFDGEAIPATEPSRQYALAKATGLVSAGSFSFGTGDTLVPAPGIVDLRNNVGTSLTLSEASYVLAFKETGSSDNNAAIIFTPTVSGVTYYSIQAGSELGVAVGRIVGTVWNGESVIGKGWTFIGGRFNSTSSSIHLDGVSMAEGSGSSPITIPYIYMGGGGPTPGGPLTGFTGPIRFDNVRWSDAEMIQFFNHIKDRLVLHGETIPKKNFYFIEGDSIDFTAASMGPSYVAQVATNLDFKPRWRMLAVSGSTIASLNTRLPATLAMIKQAVAFGHNPIIHVKIGTNQGTSLLSSFSTVQAYWTALRNAGAKVVVATITPRGDMGNGGVFTQADWIAYNNLIRGASAYYDALSDIASDSIMGDPAQCTNLSYYLSDQLHPIPAGHTRMLAYSQPAVASVKI